MSDNERKLALKGTCTLEHMRDGECIYKETGQNLITDEGMKEILGVIFDGVAADSATYYIGLFNTDTTPLVTHTYASPGFTESTDYDNIAVRATYDPASPSGSGTVTISNSASKATFTMSATTTIYGAAVFSYNDNGDTAHAGAVLMAAKKFTSARSVVDNDQLLITYEFSLTNA